MYSDVFLAPDWPQSMVEIDSVARASSLPEEEIEHLWTIYDFLAKLFSGRYRGSGRPFVNHLTGTAGLLIMHSGNPAEIRAGFAHAAYTQGEFGKIKAGASASNREAVRSVIGEEAEALVFHYQDFDWLRILDRYSKGESLPISNVEKSLLFVRLANELDDSMDCGVYDIRWCQRCLHRLELGAKVAESIGRASLASQARSRIQKIHENELLGKANYRKKQSITVLNPGLKQVRTLKLGRKIRRLVSTLLNP